MPKTKRKPGWQKQLHAGDEVSWNDPDAGLCSVTGIIAEIRFMHDNSASIVFTVGHHLEVFLSELS